MASLFFTCPTTHHEAPTGIETDVQAFKPLGRQRSKSNAHIAVVHQISVRETYINGALQDATDRLRRAI